MKKSVQKLFKGLLITTVTLLCGFGICAIFFNLFGTLTANEMKIFVALDVIILLTVGGIFYYIDEKKAKNKTPSGVVGGNMQLANFSTCD